MDLSSISAPVDGSAELDRDIAPPAFQVLSPKEKVLEEIASYHVRVRGARWIPILYLQDALTIIQRFTQSDRYALEGLSISLSWTRTIPFLLTSVAGMYVPRTDRLSTVLFQSRAAFRWIFAHELTHAMVERRPMTYERFRRSSWKPISRAPARERVFLTLQFLFGSSLAFILIHGSIAGLWPGIDLGLSLLLHAAGVLAGWFFSLRTGGMLYTLINAWRAADDTYVFDARKGWSFLTLYSLVNADEEAADLGATMIVFPERLQEKMKLNPGLKGKVDILNEGLFDGRAFVKVKPWEDSHRRWGWPTLPVAGVSLYVVAALYLAMGHIPYASLAARGYASYLSASVLLLIGMRPVISLRVHLPKLSYRWSPIIRQGVATTVGILFELQKLAIAAVLIMVYLLIQNPEAMKFDPFEAMPKAESGISESVRQPLTLGDMLDRLADKIGNAPAAVQNAWHKTMAPAIKPLPPMEVTELVTTPKEAPRLEGPRGIPQFPSTPSSGRLRSEIREIAHESIYTHASGENHLTIPGNPFMSPRPPSDGLVTLARVNAMSLPLSIQGASTMKVHFDALENGPIEVEVYVKHPRNGYAISPYHYSLDIGRRGNEAWVELPAGVQISQIVVSSYSPRDGIPAPRFHVDSIQFFEPQTRPLNRVSPDDVPKPKPAGQLQWQVVPDPHRLHQSA